MITWKTSMVASRFYNDKIVFFALSTSIIILFTSLILIFLSFSSLPPEIPVFYSTKTKILGPKNFIFLMPTIIFLTLIVNTIIPKISFLKMKFLTQTLAIATAVVAFLILWAELEIILLF